MGEVTRRTFLARASIAAAGVTSGAAVINSVVASAIPAAGATPVVRGVAPAPGDPLVAHVRNIATGEVAVLMGTREVVYRDPALVARLMGVVR